jgi:hypothetical protein
VHQSAAAVVEDGLWSWPFAKDGRELKIRTIDINRYTALAGLGLAYSPGDFVSEGISNRQLTRVLPDWTPQSSGYHLYSRPDCDRIVLSACWSTLFGSEPIINALVQLHSNGTETGGAVSKDNDQRVAGGPLARLNASAP